MSSEIEVRASAAAAIPMVNGQLVPQNFEGIQRLAKFMHTTGMVPQNDRNPCTLEQTILLVTKAFELGLPFTAIAGGMLIVRNKPAVWGDVMLALVQRCPEFVSILEKMEGDEAVCLVVRMRKLLDGTYERSGCEIRFSIQDAKTAGLWGKSGPWTQYPKRMLKMRARAFALRDMFADILNGMGMAEELRDIPPDSKEVEESRAADITHKIENLAVEAKPVFDPESDAPVQVDDGGVFSQMGLAITQSGVKQ